MMAIRETIKSKAPVELYETNAQGSSQDMLYLLDLVKGIYIRLALIMHLEIYPSIIAVVCQIIWPNENDSKSPKLTYLSTLPG